MKRTLKIGDIIKIVAKDRKKYPLIDYTVKIIKVTSRYAKGKQMFVNGSLYGCTYNFNKNYDDSDFRANAYVIDHFDCCLDRFVIPQSIEVWRKVPRFEDAYEVSQFGRVRNFKTNHILKPYTSKSHRHPQVMLRLNSEFREQHGVSHLVMAAFNPTLVCVGFGDKVVYHKDGNIKNNRLENLYVK